MVESVEGVEWVESVKREFVILSEAKNPYRSAIRLQETSQKLETRNRKLKTLLRIQQYRHRTVV